ncbi:MAG TPA: cytochrome c oxidase subunit II [Solirubrobacterales bacterium]|nr:cytochrome c oxidase subunit II [Solirubrobacterales bacterium]
MKEPNHLRRIAIAWLVLSAIATPIVVAVIAPTLPPGNGTSASSGQVFDNTVLLGVVTPIAALMVVYFAYSLVVFRRREEGPQEGVAIHGDSRVHVPWLVLTTIVVLFLAAFGTVELTDAGAGGGEGPSPAFKPSGRAMPVQVIAQQWEFTYRYPTFGGIETARLELPVGRQVEFHVTSLDVIHSFWAPKLGVKADANPGVDNVAYVKPEEEEAFELRCSELCGLWHGYMFDTGQVVSDATFLRWIHNQQRVFAPAAKQLPKYSTHYFPEPDRRAG